MKPIISSLRPSHRYGIIFGILLLVIGLFFLLPFSHTKIIHIDNTELTRLMSEGVPLIDIRTTDEWKTTGVISGSRLITFFDEQGQVDGAQWLALVKTIAAPNQPVILICRGGGRSQKAAKFLSETAGYETVYNVKHGLMGWLEEHRPVIPAEKP